MIGITLAFVFCFFLMLLTIHGELTFVRISRAHLAFMPLATLVVFFHHNLDSQKVPEPRWLLLLPVFLSLLILMWSLIGFFRKNKSSLLYFFDIGMIAFIIYAIGSVSSALFSENPGWALYAITWTLPFGVIFYFAGRATSLASLGLHSYFSWTVILACSFSIAIVAFALLSGRASSLVNTRSYGSILATPGTLRLLMIFLPFAVFEIRREKYLQILFWTIIPLLMSISLSRSVLFPFLVFAASICWKIKQSSTNSRSAISPIALLAGAICAFGIIALALDPDWLTSFMNLPHAATLRLERFWPYWATVGEGNPFLGIGFGLTRYYHPEQFTDLHNLLLTEIFENGLLAGIAVFVILCEFLYLGFKSLNREIWPIGLAGILTVAMAHTTGINFGVRSPLSYNTPYFLCAFFFLYGFMKGQIFSSMLGEQKEFGHKIEPTEESISNRPDS